jgi:acetyl-CoA acyltransferase
LYFSFIYYFLCIFFFFLISFLAFTFISFSFFFFAVLSWEMETGVDARKVNILGGAIALGHPVGATGSRLVTTMLNVLETKRLHTGLIAICEGGGMANACIIERVE